MPEKDNIDLRVTSSFVWTGRILVPGSGLSLSERDAKPLLRRGKVVLAEAAADGAEPAAKKPAAKKPAEKSAETGEG